MEILNDVLGLGCLENSVNKDLEGKECHENRKGEISLFDKSIPSFGVLFRVQLTMQNVINLCRSGWDCCDASIMGFEGKPLIQADSSTRARTHTHV